MYSNVGIIPEMTEQEWEKLENHGWEVKTDKHIARKIFANIKDALEDFERITGTDVTKEIGSAEIHTFEWTDSGGKFGQCSGEGCIKYLFPDLADLVFPEKKPETFREAVELL